MLTLKKNISEIKKLLSERQKEAHPEKALSRFLIAKGINPTIVKEIAKEFALKGENYKELDAIIAKRIHAAAPLDFSQPHICALVGPTGVGKTTTISKLLNFYAKQGKKVAITKTDLPIFECESTYDLLLIDTEGCNFYQPQRVDEIGEKLAKYPPLQIWLTLSAATKDVDLYGAVHQFSPLQPSALIFTKLDETLAPGSLINVSTKTDLPLRYVAFGYPLPGEVHLADPLLIAHKILTDLNQDEFHFLRQMKLME